MKAKRLHNWGRTVIMLFMAMLLFFSFVFISHANASNIPFKDVQSNEWYYNAVQYTYEKGLFSGTSDTTFTPNQPMTRGMFVTVLGKLAVQFGENIDGYSNTFTDVSSNHYANRYIGWASNKGIVAGYSSTTFGVEDSITREQMAVIIYRFSKVLNIELKQTQNIDFPDKSNFSEYAREAIGVITGAKILSGHDTGKFEPQGLATRAQVAQLFYNADFYQYIKTTMSDLTVSVKSSYTTEDNITISWTGVNSVARYSISIYDYNETNPNMPVTKYTTSTSLNIGKLPASSKYLLIVRAHDSEDKVIAYSHEYIWFSVTTPTPGSLSISAKSSYTTSDSITISWTTASSAVKYGLTVTNRSTNKEVISQSVTGNSKNIGTLPAGDYTVSMKGINSDGKGGPTTSVYFTVTQATVPTPGSFSISVNSSYTTSQSITISWTTASNATKYGLTVRNRSTNKDVFDQYVTGNSKNIGTLPAGNYLIYMKAYNSAGKSGSTIGPVYVTVKAVSTYQKAMFIMDTLNVSQGRNTGSHKGDKYNTYAIDLAGKDTGIDYAYAPFDGKVVRVEANTTYGNAVWFQSTSKVEYANGTIDYMTLYLVHINTSTMNQLGIKVGKTFKQGEKFYAEGTYGNSSGNHIHLVTLRGKVSGYNEGTVVYQENALYLSKSTTIKSTGGLSWKRVS